MDLMTFRNKINLFRYLNKLGLKYEYNYSSISGVYIVKLFKYQDSDVIKIKNFIYEHVPAIYKIVLLDTLLFFKDNPRTIPIIKLPIILAAKVPYGIPDL